ncbi:MAG: methyltransferase domain-containing protein [Bdellovibrionaceae bacterium]|nr:methyltransferase domain-containing protein [Pseudobdellovibrionaceae bacterium]
MPISFDMQDPFPFVAEGEISYGEAQEHARQCDVWLGLRTEETEAEIQSRVSLDPISPGEQHWIGLPVKALLTPYTELREIVERLRPRVEETVIDFGAGYGRMAFVLARHFPDVNFIGYEIVPERVRESLRCLHEQGYSRAQMWEADLSSSMLMAPAAEYYFIYDFGSRNAIEKVLQDLRIVASQQRIVVVGRGRATRDAIEQKHPWLSQVQPPEHFAHYSIYRS